MLNDQRYCRIILKLKICQSSFTKGFGFVLTSWAELISKISTMIQAEVSWKRHRSAVLRETLQKKKGKKKTS